MAFGNSGYAPPPPGIFWLVGLMVSVAGGLIGLLVYVSFAGPSGVTRIKSWEVDEAAVIEWMRGSAEAEETFRREFDRFPDHLKVYEHLQTAIRYQRKLKAMDPYNAFGSGTRLTKLMRLLENTKGSALRSIVIANGRNAAEFLARGNKLSAVPLLEEALVHQQWINEHLRDSDFVDRGEVSRLKQWLAGIQTVDALAEVDSIYGRAKEAYAASNWVEAERLFDRALEIQESINHNMPESPHARWGFIQELKAYKLRIEAGRMNQRIEALLASSGEGVNRDRLRRAINLQALLNENYEATEFADPERLESLKLTMVSVRSQAAAALLQQLSAELDLRLRERNWALVRRTLVELDGSVAEFGNEYSLALLPEPDLKERVDWLMGGQSDMEAISAALEPRLVAHPRLPVRVYATEVDQILYQQVMGTNPSRWSGDGLPVDSVSVADAQLFCKRLGWLLGQTVELPRMDWLEGLVEIEWEGHGFWFSHNSGFRSKPVGQSRPVVGLYDLIGNLEEWVVDEEGRQVLGLFGGCGADSVSKVKNEPLTPVPENFRSRWTGFRFCILDDTLMPFPSPN